MSRLSETVEVRRVMNAAVADTDDTLKSDIVDLAGYDGVLFLILLGDVAAGGSAVAKVAVSDANDTEQMDLLAGDGASTGVAEAANKDNKVLAVDVINCDKRYVELQIARADEDIIVDGVIAILYRGGHQPVSQGATVAALATYGPLLSIAA
jgi:hypothetical protein